MLKKKETTAAAKKAATSDDKPSCGLCSKTGKLTKTDCCGQWICNDEGKYVLFSYARNSCHRNHDRYTLCSHHHNERHKGDWQTCEECKADYETEMYVWYGTNEYNFVKLENPPKFQPTKCAKCKRVIKLATDGYTIKGGKYYCMGCLSFGG